MLLTDIGTLQIRALGLLPRQDIHGRSFRKFWNKTGEPDCQFNSEENFFIRLHPLPVDFTVLPNASSVPNITLSRKRNGDIDSAPNRNGLHGTFLDFKGDLEGGQFDGLILLSLSLPAPASLSPPSSLPLPSASFFPPSPHNPVQEDYVVHTGSIVWRCSSFPALLWSYSLPKSQFTYRWLAR